MRDQVSASGSGPDGDLHSEKSRNTTRASAFAEAQRWQEFGDSFLEAVSILVGLVHVFCRAQSLAVVSVADFNSPVHIAEVHPSAASGKLAVHVGTHIAMLVYAQSEVITDSTVYR